MAYFRRLFSDKMKPDPKPAAAATPPTATGSGEVFQDTKPLVKILSEGDGLDDWLTSHPPSRLGVPAAFNNGAPAVPIWVLAVNSIDQIAELGANVNADETFLKAQQLKEDSVAKLEEIKQDDNIPVRPSIKSGAKSKKQCRTEVQETFYEQVMVTASQHPLWNQGKWTMLVRPQQIDRVFAQLAHSLATGDLHKHGNILALRARTLPLHESSFEYNHSSSPKRKKGSSSSRRSSSGSPTSPRHADKAPLGIDIFFQPVWSSSTARDVLKLIAEVSGRMASFCKSSLYSCLGIRYEHELGAHASLYNAKTLASPAEIKAWKMEHDSGNTDTEEACPFSDTRPSNAPTGSSATLTEEHEMITVQSAKRESETEVKDHTTASSEEPATKKARIEETTSNDPSVSAVKDVAGVSSSDVSQVDTQETQDEPMLPVRRTARSTKNDIGLDAVFEEPKEKSAPSAVDEKPEGASVHLDALAAEESAELKGTPLPFGSSIAQKQAISQSGDESQTQVEPKVGDGEAAIAKEAQNGQTTAKAGEGEIIAAAGKDVPAQVEPQAVAQITAVSESKDDPAIEHPSAKGAETKEADPTNGQGPVVTTSDKGDDMEVDSKTIVGHSASGDSKSATVEQPTSEAAETKGCVSSLSQQATIKSKGEDADLVAVPKAATEERAVGEGTSDLVIVEQFAENKDVAMPAPARSEDNIFEHRFHNPLDDAFAVYHSAVRPLHDNEEPVKVDDAIQTSAARADVAPSVQGDTVPEEAVPEGLSSGNVSVQASNGQVAAKTDAQADSTSEPAIAEVGKPEAVVPRKEEAVAQDVGASTLAAQKETTAPVEQLGANVNVQVNVDVSSSQPPPPSADRAESQDSAMNGHEMSLDELIHEGATTSPALAAQPVEEDSAEAK